MRLAWQRLIRFVGENGEIYHGEPVLDVADDIIDLAARGKLFARLTQGAIFDETATIAAETVKVIKLLSPLSAAEVPIIRCVGLNYLEHVKEVSVPVPKYPVTFIKPATSLASWNEDIPLPKLVQDDQADYEGELCFVIGKAAKDVAAEQALDYVAGFMVGNDVSSRKWQSDRTLSGPVPQFNFSKGFDKFAPMGPMLVSTTIVPTGNDLRLQTRVNGELRQDTNTSNLIFDIGAIVAFCSQGTTLQPGCVIMTGTPPGAGFSMSPPRTLQHGDLVEVSIEKLGTTRNRFIFA